MLTISQMPLVGIYAPVLTHVCVSSYVKYSDTTTSSTRWKFSTSFDIFFGNKKPADV